MNVHATLYNSTSKRLANLHKTFVESSTLDWTTPQLELPNVDWNVLFFLHRMCVFLFLSANLFGVSASNVCYLRQRFGTSTSLCSKRKASERKQAHTYGFLR